MQGELTASRESDQARRNASSKRASDGACWQWWIVLAAGGAFALRLGRRTRIALRRWRWIPASGSMDISAPTTPPEEIIKKFAAKESEFQEALNHYTYRRVARVQTIDDDNKVDGE